MEDESLKQSQLELIQNRDLTEAIYNESPDAIFLVNPVNMLIFDCNSRAVEMFEATSKEQLIGIEGQTLQKEQFTEDELGEINEEISRLGFWSREIEYISQKGRYFWGNLAVKRIKVAGEAINLVRVTDISQQKAIILERQKAETELSSLSERLKLALNSAQIGTWDWDIIHDRLIWDERMYELYGVNPSDFSGAYEAWEQGLHPEDLPRAIEASQQALRGENEYKAEFRVVCSDGTIRTLKANAIVQHNSQGEPQRMIGINYDISELKQAAKTLELQAVITRNMAEGICLVRVDNGIIVYANPKFEQMFGYEPGELKDKHVSIVNYPTETVSQEEINQQIRCAVLEKGEHTYEVHNIKKDGTPFWCSATTSVFQHPDYGKVLVAVQQDISDRKLAETKLQQLNAELEQRIAQRTAELSQINIRLEEELRQREQLQQELMQRERLLNGFFNAASVANIGLSIHDRDLTYIRINQALADIHGLPMTQYLEENHNELIPEFASQLMPAIQQVIDTGEAINNIEVSGTTSSQPEALRYWLASFFPILGDTEEVIAVGKILLEITYRKETEKALQIVNEQLEERVNQLKQRHQEMLVLREISDFLQACLTIKEACAAITTLIQPLFPECCGAIFTIPNSRNRLEMVASWGNSPCSETFFDPKDCWALRRGRVHWINRERQDLLCNHINSQDSSLETLCIPMIAQGETLGLFYLCSSITHKLDETRQQLAITVAEQVSLAIANIILRETLQNQSIRDSLTGLFNRRYLEESLTTEILRAQRNGYSVGIIMLDIDHFKRVNDTLGHDAGDFVLKELGKLLKNIIRASDIACRYGGEEITLILPEASLEATYQKAEEIREAISQLKLYYNGKIIDFLRASLGVACYPSHGVTGSLVIQSADAALFRAKEAGRNQVVLALTFSE